MAVAEICQDAGEVKWPGVESGSQGNRAADLASDGRNVVPGCLDSVKDPLCARLQCRPVLDQGDGHDVPVERLDPRSRSSRAMALDMADWTMCASRAAAVKLPALQRGQAWDRRVSVSSRTVVAAVIRRSVQTAAERVQRSRASSTGTAHRPASISPPMADAGARVVANPARTNLDISA
jgi:hypothetical protein